jgi:hypothetical protein
MQIGKQFERQGHPTAEGKGRLYSPANQAAY